MLIERGTDRYGEVQSPVLMNILDVQTRTCPENPLPLGDAYRDEMTGHMGNPHEIHIQRAIWPELWKVNPTAVTREIEAIWQWHVVDKTSGECNRHGDGQRGCDFAMSGGEILRSFAFLYHQDLFRGHPAKPFCTSFFCHPFFLSPHLSVSLSCLSVCFPGHSGLPPYHPPRPTI